MKLQPDIAFIQESKRPDKTLSDSYLWSVSNENQGVAAFGFNDYRVEPCEILDGTPPTVLPFFITGPVRIFVLGIWAMNYPTYVSFIWNCLDLYKDVIRANTSIILGDLNSHSILDRNIETYNHAALVQRLASEFDLISSYHENLNILHGDERHQTLYWRYEESKPYHIDYCFVPKVWSESIVDVKIGDYRSFEGVSDHRPIIVDISV